ncbi:MAG: helix-turn-helix transcriptional regulator [Oscillospiraceae bacterium]|nr:helix-turn-helix transcriptional regulator [Oscillospiraceae bacterium]
MEFHEKLQALRKTHGLTQEAVAQALFVSRTAVSKWESGRGYPNIQSLKQLAKLFSVTVDELLSGEELLLVAETQTAQEKAQLRNRMCGLLDCIVAVLLFLPFFRQTVAGAVQSVSIWNLSQPASYLQLGFYAVLLSLPIVGVLLLIPGISGRWLSAVSILLSTVGILLFIVSLQPYGAAFLFVLLGGKVFLWIKRH